MLSRLNNEELRQYFGVEYDRHRNKHNPFVNWDNQKLTKQRLSTIIACMGAQVLCQFLKRLAQDYK